MKRSMRTPREAPEQYTLFGWTGPSAPAPEPIFLPHPLPGAAPDGSAGDPASLPMPVLDEGAATVEPSPVSNADEVETVSDPLAVSVADEVEAVTALPPVSDTDRETTARTPPLRKAKGQRKGRTEPSFVYTDDDLRHMSEEILFETVSTLLDPRSSEENKALAVAWMDDHRLEGFSFAVCCLILGCDPTVMRHDVLRLLERNCGVNPQALRQEHAAMLDQHGYH